MVRIDNDSLNSQGVIVVLSLTYKWIHWNGTILLAEPFYIELHIR